MSDSDSGTSATEPAERESVDDDTSSATENIDWAKFMDGPIDEELLKKMYATPLPEPATGVDLSQYRHHLDSWDMTEEDKTAYLEQLWAILGHFADLAWGMTSEQIILRERERAAVRNSFEPVRGQQTKVKKPKAGKSVGKARAARAKSARSTGKNG